MRRSVVLTMLIGLTLTACGGTGQGIEVSPSPSVERATFTPAPGTGQPAFFPPVDRGPVTFPAPVVQPPVVQPPVVQPPSAEPPVVQPPVVEPPVTFQPPPETGQSPDGARAPVRYIPQAIWDPAAGNIVAVTYLLPESWQTEGNVAWMPQWARLADLQTRIVDPSTGITIEWLPLQDFIWFQPPAGLEVPVGGNYQGKAFVPPVTDPAQFVRDFWIPGQLAHLQGATLVDISQVPVVAEEFKRGFAGPAEAYAYRMRYQFQQNGQLWDEDVFFALLYAGSPEIVSWYVNFAYTVRAPQGQLDRNQGTISTVIASRTTTPEWEGTYRVVQRLFTQGIQQQMADTVAFGQLLAQYREESAALQAQVTAERQASQDRIAELRRESLGGVETYIDPINSTLVQLPVGWNEYWVNPEGEFLTTDQPGFDPNTVDPRGWQRLQLRDP